MHCRNNAQKLKYLLRGNTSERQFTCFNSFYRFELRQTFPNLDKTFFRQQIPLTSAHLGLFRPLSVK